MEEEVTGGGMRLGKKPMEMGGEVDYKTKAGTAWSHSYLNQKPWHPLSYPNQRRKWIAEQTHANRDRRAEEVAREFAQEQEFFRQTALFSKKEKEKVEMMKAVSFMYVRPPGYNVESAKAAEVADEKKRLDQSNTSQDPTSGTACKTPETRSDKNQTGGDKKARPKDVFGRPLPTEEEFEALKNAPRLETGVPVRIKPFGVEIRNVRCVRCGTYGHQSGDRECPLKDAIMPNEESRLKRDDPLTAIMAQTDSSEPLKWELKQKPGMSPPRGGFQPDDPNQQIVADDIFDEYGGFLSGDIPALLSNFSASKSKKHSKHKRKHKHQSPVGRTEPHHGDQQPSSSSDSEVDKESKRLSKSKPKKQRYSKFSSPSSSEVEVQKEGRRQLKRKHKQHHSETSSTDGEFYEENRRRSKGKHKKQHKSECSAPSYPGVDKESRRHSKSRQKQQHHSESLSSDSIFDKENRRQLKSRQKERYRSESPSSNSIFEKEGMRYSKSKQKEQHRSVSPSSDKEGRRHLKSRQKKDRSESPSSDTIFDKKSRRHPKSGQKEQYNSESPYPDSIFDKESRRHSKSRPRQRHRSESPSSDSSFDKESSKHSKSKQKQQQHSHSPDCDSTIDNKKRHSNSKQKQQHWLGPPPDPKFDKESRRHSKSKRN